jgi:hypothetical protein
MATETRVDQLLSSPLGRELLLNLIDRRSCTDWSTGHEWSTEPEVREAVRAAAARPPLPTNTLDFLLALERTTFIFGFMGYEWLWRLTKSMTDELRPVAEDVVAAVAPYGWWEPVERTDQRLLLWDGQPEVVGAGIEALVRDGVERARAENEESSARHRPRRGQRNVGAAWWSPPSFAPLTWTTRHVPPLPSVALLPFFDTFRPFEPTGARVFALEIDPSAHVYEVNGPEDWRCLVEAFPMDVTGTHDGEWRRWGDVAGPWCLPDWSAVVERYDGVHVSVGGYVASCGLALRVGDAYTMLSAWIPDATFWLRDVAVDRRLLGRWDGNPTSGAAELLSGWIPIDS